MLPAAQTWTHAETQNVNGEERSQDEDRARGPLHANPNLYRAAIKAGLYRKAVQVCYIPNTTTYSGIRRGHLPPSVAGSFQMYTIHVFSYGEIVSGWVAWL